jgi:hypothetical protein
MPAAVEVVFGLLALLRLADWVVEVVETLMALLVMRQQEPTAWVAEVAAIPILAHPAVKAVQVS